MKMNGGVLKLRIFCLSAILLFLTGYVCRAQFPSDSSVMEGGLAGQVLASAKEHKNRTIYTTLSPKIIDATPDKNLSQVVTDYARSKMNWSLSNEIEVLANESDIVRSVYIISQIEAEVNTGGFKQLFSGSASKLGELGETAFRAINAHSFAEVLKKATTLYHQEGLTDKFKDLDEQFYSLYDKEDLCKLRVNYIRKNKKAFKAS
ncbi:DMP19 family protein [Pararcticibacter amylolyticus]|uniref:DNA mimic protein DMP19 C-terminal domain-containing protein n=1 Tax=Pararcticibacter amylolyticus TaxID=2173175 RepID=A0A2U2PD72_9SPHI|nr:DUF4375 domain-containing protein [Pararcticibacter amylolyticus]PWG79069.1 hypothetical protein DDR33_18615 [Pararcticibacter amylolyticus]